MDKMLNRTWVTRQKKHLAIDALLVITVSALVLAMAAVIHMSGRGLDIGDEGYYLVSSQHPEDLQSSLTSAPWYTARLFYWAGQDLYRFRLAGLALLLGGAGVFSYGLSRLLRNYLQADKRTTVATVTSTLLGTLLFYTVTVPTPSYNLLNTAALYASAGVACLLLSGRRGQKKLAFTCGLPLGLDFFIKFPTSIAMAGLLLTGLLTWPLRQRIYLALSMLAGMAAYATLHFLLVQHFSVWLSNLRQGLVIDHLLQGRHNLGLLKSYAVQTLWLGFDIMATFGLLYFLVLTAFTVLRGRQWQIRITIIAVPLFFAVATGSGLLGNGKILSFNGRLIVFYLGYLLLLVQLLRLNRLGLNRQVIHLITLLVLLPFAGALGTNNPLWLNATYGMAPCLAAIVILLKLLAGRLQQPVIFYGGALALCLGAASQVIYTAQEAVPYNNKAPYSRQIHALSIGSPRSTINVDLQTRQFIDTVRQIAVRHGFQSGDDLLAFYDMAGIVYALGARSPALAWYIGAFPGSKAQAEYALSIAPHQRLSHAFILEKGDRRKMPDLNRLGIRFPEGYELCGQAIWPRTGEPVFLWKPGWRSTHLSHASGKGAVARGRKHL